MKKKILVLCLLPLFILGMTQCRHETIETYKEAGYQHGVATSPEEGKEYVPTITDGNNIRAVDANAYICNVLKIDGKAGNL